MKTRSPATAWLCSCVLIACTGVSNVQADVKASGSDGFHILVERETQVDSQTAYGTMVKDFGTWWGGDHSFSGDAKNLSLDLQRRCMLEKLPDGGFVRHMEIVFHQPGKMMVMRGGLGPLQAMGANGSLILRFDRLDSGKTKVTLDYHVHGPSYQKLDNLAKVVDGVLEGQLDQLIQHLDRK